MGQVPVDIGCRDIGDNRLVISAENQQLRQFRLPHVTRVSLI